MITIYDWAAKWGVPQAALDDLGRVFEPDYTSRGEGQSESALQAHLRVLAARDGATLWRNNRGAMLDSKDRMVRYGLANDSSRLDKVFKSSDLIGITPVDYMGRRFGVFTAVECKAPDWKFSTNDDRAVAQHAFLAKVATLGGIAMFARTQDDYDLQIRMHRK